MLHSRAQAQSQLLYCLRQSTMTLRQSRSQSAKGGTVKYLALWEMKPEDAPKVFKKFQKKIKTGTETLFGAGLKTLFGPYHIGFETRGFTVLETENPAELANYSNYYLPELQTKIYPIIDSEDMLASWMKYHK